MKKRATIVILIILLLGILFPFAAMTKLSTGYAVVFNSIFNAQLMHILMHMALFGCLSWIVMSFTSKKSVQLRVLMCLGSVLLVGIVQETIQMISIDTYNLGASLFDLGIDLAGGLIPIAFYLVISKVKKNQIMFKKG